MTKRNHHQYEAIIRTRLPVLYEGGFEARTIDEPLPIQTIW